MDYRRRALLRSKQTAPTSPPANRLDRVVAISSIVSNIVIGLGTLALAGIGIHLTNEFNQWQKADSNQAQQQVAFAVCISAAQLVFDAIKFRPEKDAANIIQTAVTGRSDCTRYGVNIPDLVATMILEDRTNIDPKIVQRAAKRVFLVSAKSSAGKKVSTDETLENITNIIRQSPKYTFVKEPPNTSSTINLKPIEIDWERFFSDVECNSKLDAEVKAKPNDPSWSVVCDDGKVIARPRSAF